MKRTHNSSLSSHVVGICYLEGLRFDDNEAADSTNPQSQCRAGNVTAGIDLSKSLQPDGQELLQAKVTYSSLYSFSLSLSDEIYKQIIYDTIAKEETAKINLNGLTDFFELKCMIIKDKHIIDMLKFANERNQTLRELSKHRIRPEAFYASGKGGHNVLQVFESFPRQELAFRHFDDLLEKHSCSIEKRDNPIKLFTFESLMTGKRQFLVADMQSFMQRYLSLEGTKRHCYEIIREDFPCRLYFDLEYSIPANPDVNGADLVARWIHIVSWKLYEVFGITVGADNFIDLDSSNAIKFSRHLIVILNDTEDISWSSAEGSPDATPTPSKRRRTNTSNILPSIPGREYLFRNNIEVGKFVDIIVGDVLMNQADTLLQENNGEAALSPGTHFLPEEKSPHLQAMQLPRLHANKITNPAQDALFVWNSERTAKTCFVDLGVHTRNRAFRLLSSCKFGKTSRLRVASTIPTPCVTPSVVSGDGPQQCSTNCRKVNHFVKRCSGSDSGSVPHNELFACIVQRTFVVPMSVMHSIASDNIEGKCVESTDFSVLPSMNHMSFKIPMMHSPSVVACSSSARDVPSAATRRFCMSDSNTEIVTTVTVETLASSQNSHPIKASPFPFVDEFIKSLASRGGSVGRISQWVLKSTTTATSAPPTEAIVSGGKAEVADHTNYSDDRENADKVVNTATSSDGVVVPMHSSQRRDASISTISLEYQIVGNRFCQNINRAHKSNNIMFEVNLNSGFVRQKCWDVDCRGFRSDPMYLPIQSSPSMLEINEVVGDIVILNALRTDPTCL